MDRFTSEKGLWLPCVRGIGGGQAGKQGELPGGFQGGRREMKWGQKEREDPR